MRGKRTNHPLGRRTLAALLAICMLLTMTPAVAAEVETRTLTGFAALGDAVREQTVPHGTAREDLTLPDTLEATALVPAPSEPGEGMPTEEPPVQETEPPAADHEQEPPAGQTLPMEQTPDPAPEEIIGDAEPPLVDVPTAETVFVTGVTWESAPAYDGAISGTYIFTPVLPAAYVPAAGVSLPVITVTVAEQEPTPMDFMVRNGAAVTVVKKNIYANGLPIVLTGGDTEALTIICGTDRQPLTIEGLPDNTTGGTNLQSYTIYGGANGSDVTSAAITMEGGSVYALYAGGSNGNVTGTAALALTDSAYVSFLYGDGYTTSTGKGMVQTSSVTIAGGSVNNGAWAAARATTSAALTITGGYISGCVRGNTTGQNVKPTLTIGGGAVIGGYNFEGIFPEGFQGISIASGGFTDLAGISIVIPSGFSGPFATNAKAGDEKYFILFGAGAAGNAAVVQSGGIELAAASLSKDSEERYQITSEADLRFMRDQVNAQNADYASASYIQTADLVLSGFNWFPIGGKCFGGISNYTSIAPFSGHYDGGGHTITGMTALWPRLYAVGLFGLYDPRVQNQFSNLTMERCAVSGLYYVGTLLGGGVYKNNPPHGPQITNCHVTSGSTVSGTAENIGGLVGTADRATLTNCTASADVSGIKYCGGLAGQLGNSLGVSGCHATGDVTAVRQGNSSYKGQQIGGLIGSISAADANVTMTDCSATGNVSARTENQIPNPNLSSWISQVGGLCGQVNKITVSGSFATGSVSGEVDVGGLVGYATGYNSPSSIASCYATGDVTGSICDVGGLVGDADNNTAITSSYASGEVSSAGYSVGGLVGNMNGSVQTSWASGSVKGTYNVGGLLGNGAYSTAKHCYAIGNVTGTDWNVGGVVGCGENGTVENCFATGAVQSKHYKAGGIAGTGGTIKNCAALNPSVTSSGSNATYKPTVGRVCGDFTKSTLENNFAFDGMVLTVDSAPVSPISGAANNLHGADGSVGLCQSADSYPESAGWTAANGWTVTDGGNEYLALALTSFGAVPTPEHLRYTPLDIIYLGGADRNDAHDGSSPENAVATANKAVELAADSGVIVICGDTTAPTSKTLVENKSLTFTNTDGTNTYDNAVLRTYYPTFLSNVTLSHLAWQDVHSSKQCEVGKDVTLTLDSVTVGPGGTSDLIRFIAARDTGAHLIIRDSNFSGKVSYLCKFESITLDKSVATALYTNSFPSDASDFILKNGSTLSVSKDIKALTSEGEGNTIQARKLSGQTLVPVTVLGSIQIDPGKPIVLTNYFEKTPKDGVPYLTSNEGSLTVDKFTLSGETFTPVKYNAIIYAASRSVSTLAPTNLSKESADLHGVAATQFPLGGAEFVYWKAGNELSKQTVSATVSNDDNTFSAALARLDANTLYYVQAIATIGGVRCAGNTLSFRSYAEESPTGSIGGSVTNNTGALCDITVTIEEGNTVRATQVLSNVADSTNSSFSFSTLPDGFYNVVADNGAYKVTCLVEIKGGAAVVDVALALGKTQSVVDIVTPDTPPAAVDGLPEQFEDSNLVDNAKGNTGYTPDDKIVVTSGGTVELKLAVERKEEASVSADAALIAGAAAGQTIPIYLDLTVTKTVIPTSGVATETKLVSVPKLLTVVFPLPDEVVGKQNITIYRVHNGTAEALPKADPGGSGEWAEISGANAILHIRQFSTYAVGYTKSTPPVVPDYSGGGSSTYPPNINHDEHGSTTVSPKNPGSGDRVTITPKPDEGYLVDKVVVTDKNGKEVAIKDNGDGSYTFTQPVGKVTITVTFKPIPPVWNPFNDVTEKDWFHDSVRYVYENGLMVGTSDTAFSPHLDTSRGMIVTILWRIESEPSAIDAAPFHDIVSGQYYSDAVAWGAESGIVKGYDNGNYGPSDPITREQLASILWRYARYKKWDVSVGENTNILSYLDFPQISEYAIPALQWAAGAQIMSGKGDGILDPKGNATRAETATMLERFLKDKR